MTNDQVDFSRQNIGPQIAVTRQDGVRSRDVQPGLTNPKDDDDPAEISKYDFITECGREFHFSKVNDNCQQLIEKISGEKCLRCNGYTLFESFPTFLKDFLNLEIRDDDVWVCSFPRSGTHWTLEMVWCIINDLDLETALSTPLHLRCPYVELNALRFAEDIKLYFQISNIDTPIGTNLVQQMKSPRIIWSHLPFDLLPLQLQKGETKAKIIYIVRDVRDVCVSEFNFFKNAKQHCTFENFCQMFLRGDVLNGPYWKHVLSYRKEESNENLLIVEYEKMLKNLPSILSDVGKFLGKNLQPADILKLCDHLSLEKMRRNLMINTNLADFYKKLQKDEVVGNVIRSGKYGQWEETMSPAVKLAFQEDIEYYTNLK